MLKKKMEPKNHCCYYFVKLIINGGLKHTVKTCLSCSLVNLTAFCSIKTGQDASAVDITISTISRLIVVAGKMNQVLVNCSVFLFNTV